MIPHTSSSALSSCHARWAIGRLGSVAVIVSTFFVLFELWRTADVTNTLRKVFLSPQERSTVQQRELRISGVGFEWMVQVLSEALNLFTKQPNKKEEEF